MISEKLNMSNVTINQELELVKVKGHNLVHLFPDKVKTREELADLLIQAKYVNLRSDPFIDFMLSLPELAQNPRRRFVIVANELDIVCESCPIWQRQKGSGCIGGYQYEADKHCAESYGLELGKVYTARELAEHVRKSPRY